MQRNDLLVAGEVDKQTVLNQRLSAAIASGNLNEVRALAARGAALFKDDPDETTPLIQAITLNNTDMVTTLVDLMVEHSYYNEDGSPRYSALVSLFNSPCLKSKYQHDENLRINLRKFLAVALEREAGTVIGVHSVEILRKEIDGLTHILKCIDLLQGKGGLFRMGEKTAARKISKRKERLESKLESLKKWCISSQPTICGFAVSKGHVATVAEMLNKGIVSVNGVCLPRFYMGIDKTLLEVASREGHLSMVNFLIAKDANVNFGKVGALDSAISFGHTQVAKVLIEAGADLFGQIDHLVSPLVRAIRFNQAEVIVALIDAMIQKPPRCEDGSIYSPIIFHLNSIDIKMLSPYMMSFKALIRTCLVAALSKKLERLKAEDNLDGLRAELRGIEDIRSRLDLIQGKGGFAKSAEKKTAMVAIEAMITDLKDSIKAIETPDTSPASFVAAADSGDYFKVERLLVLGADINQADADGRTALYCAARQGALDVVNLLITNGAEVNLAGPKGNTPLKIASWYGHRNVVEALITAKADVNLANWLGGVTPLHMASVKGHVDIVRLLIKNKAEINLRARSDATALLLAASADTQQTEVVDLLIQAGAKPDFLDEHRVGPLYAAAERGYLDVVNRLLEGGANPIEASLNSDRPFPFQIAWYKNHQAVKERLHAALNQKIRSLIPGLEEAEGQGLAAGDYTQLIDYLNEQAVNYRYGGDLRKLIRDYLLKALNDMVLSVRLREDKDEISAVTNGLAKVIDGLDVIKSSSKKRKIQGLIAGLLTWSNRVSVTQVGMYRVNADNDSAPKQQLTAFNRTDGAL